MKVELKHCGPGFDSRAVHLMYDTNTTVCHCSVCSEERIVTVGFVTRRAHERHVQTHVAPPPPRALAPERPLNRHERRAEASRRRREQR